MSHRAPPSLDEDFSVGGKALAAGSEAANFAILRDTMSGDVVHKYLLALETKKAAPRRKSAKAHKTEFESDAHQLQGVVDGDEMVEFVDYLATELWTSMSVPLREASFNIKLNAPEDYPSSLIKKELHLNALPSAIADTLIGYGILEDNGDVEKLVLAVIEKYLDAATAPPPVWSSTRTDECELCGREIPLSYHHLIPRSTHAKVLKRGWHPEHELNRVAWLCRQCHSAVHRCVPNEELARNFHTVELLETREDIQKFVKYIAKQPYRLRVKRTN